MGVGEGHDLIAINPVFREQKAPSGGALEESCVAFRFANGTPDEILLRCNTPEKYHIR